MGISIAEVTGLPVYYVDTAVPESAGDGNMRVINCITRHGVLIPQFEVVIHPTRLIIAARNVTAFAESLFNQEMMAIGARH